MNSGESWEAMTCVCKPRTDGSTKIYCPPHAEEARAKAARRNRWWSHPEAVGAGVYRGNGVIPCCSAATPRYCVCMGAYDCPAHGELHVGTHE